MKQPPPFYVITGGPGTGKTTILAELARHGHSCVREDARALIQEQVAGGGNAVPWLDAPQFAEILMRRSIETYNAQADRWRCQMGEQSQAPIYFDRGIGDAYTCADLIGHVLPSDLREEAMQHRYRDPVFLAPWWPEIYSIDAERRQSREEAERTEHAIVKTHTQLGYRILQLPLADPAERADFILHNSDCE